MEQVKDTAVQWLIQQLECRLEILSEHKLFEQAKAMEKEQIIDAVHLPKEKRWYDAKLYNSSGEQYYNETYEK